MELRIPTDKSEALPFCEKDFRTPIPMAIPIGVMICGLSTRTIRASDLTHGESKSHEGGPEFGDPLKQCNSGSESGTVSLGGDL